MNFACRRSQTGFSLIEMIVAMVILSLSLGMLYQAAAGATRNVRIDERYSYAVLLAQSLLAEHSVLAAPGINAGGEIEDYRWRLSSALLPGEQGIGQVRLHQVTAPIEWRDGANTRQVELVTVAPEAPADG
ncbi:MAG: prepilin-type N-terminal cleavage/methylation domain-containing protein [Haliea sp.]|uniref:type IV pilus modification PilV family protein n=1 Tax=Haliea sp. TaxID=1932666 RepID=UPI0032EBD3FB